MTQCFCGYKYNISCPLCGDGSLSETGWWCRKCKKSIEELEWHKRRDEIFNQSPFFDSIEWLWNKIKSIFGKS